MFLFKTVLFEKHIKRSRSLTFCCYINDISVFTDSNSDKNGFITGRQEGKEIINFVVSGYESERLKTDSFIIWHLLKAMKERQSKWDKNEKR